MTLLRSFPKSRKIDVYDIHSSCFPRHLQLLYSSSGRSHSHISRQQHGAGQQIDDAVENIRARFGRQAIAALFLYHMLSSVKHGGVASPLSEHAPHFAKQSCLIVD